MFKTYLVKFLDNIEQKQVVTNCHCGQTHCHCVKQKCACCTTEKKLNKKESCSCILCQNVAKNISIKTQNKICAICGLDASWCSHHGEKNVN